MSGSRPIQVSGSAILMLGAWLALHKDSFIALTTYGLESQHIQVRRTDGAQSCVASHPQEPRVKRSRYHSHKNV